MSRVGSESKAVAKLKKKYKKWPPRRRLRDLKSAILIYLPASVSVWILRKFLVKSDYSLKRESSKFFELCNRSYARKKISETDRLLHIALNMLGLDVSDSFSILLRDSVVSTLNSSKNRRDLTQRLLSAARNLDGSMFDATGWYQLSRGLFYLGYFRAAWIARENSLDLSIIEGSKFDSGATAVSRAVEAHLERLDLDSVHKVLSETKVLGPKALASFRESLRWFGSDLTVCSANDGSDVGGSKQLIHNLVNGKKVALVGPGCAHGEHGDEIDSADIVARIKYPGAEYLLDEKLFGKRCDISQYPGLEPLRELAAVSSNEYFDYLQLIIAGGTDSRPVRNTPVFCEDQELPMYRTTVTSGIRLLITLIRRSPSSLKIFGYNFYTEREPYSAGMKLFYENVAWKMGVGFLFGTRDDYPKVEITSSFGAHDPVSNFCFAQNLYKAGLFDIEPYGKSILELTPYQYVERLEEMLGDW